MSLGLSDLVTPQTADQWLAFLLQYLQGVGPVVQVGLGSGKITAAGVPSTVYDVVITIMSTGELGTGTFTYLLTDSAGVETQGDTLTIPAGGTYLITETGITFTFVPGTDGDSFIATDTYTLTLTTPGFPVTSWQEGSVPRTMLEAFAAALADGDQSAAAMAAGGLLSYVSGIGLAADSWLDLLGADFYKLTRNPAISTQGTVTLTDAGSAGPFTIGAGTVWVSDASGKRFSNVNGGTLTLGGTLSLTFQAERPGAAYNVGNTTITVLLTALAGVTVTNPVGGGSWITTAGVDKESNSSYITRCQQRWPALGVGGTAAAYALWAATASSSVTRTKVAVDTVLPGKVNVYLAGAAGGVSGGVVSAVQAYVNLRVPLTAVAVVASATNVPITVGGTVYVTAAKAVAAQAAAEAALAAYINALPIGGDQVSGNGLVSREKLIGMITGQVGVVDASISSPATDTLLAATEVATLTNSLSWVSV